MGFLDDLLARARGLFVSDIEPEVKPEHTRAVVSDSFDDLDWTLVESTVPALQDNIESLHREHDYVPDTYADLFNLLHQGDPIVRESAAMREERRPNHAMIQQFASLPEVRDLRLMTKHDDYATASAMLSMQPTVSEAFEQMRAAQEAQQAAAEAKAEQQQQNAALQAMANAAQGAPLGEGEHGPSGPSESELQQAVEAAEQAAADAQQQQNTADNATEQAAHGMRQQMRKAAEQAENERSDEDELMSSFGVDPGELKQMPFQERHDLAKRLRNNRLAKFAKLIGQFRQFGDAERRRKVKHAADQVVGVEMGDNLMRVLPGEFNDLATPETEDLFWLRMADKSLLQYELAGTERMGQGPIIVVCDESGSMGTEDSGATREAWSKALALALADQARRGGRDFIYIGFSSVSQQWRIDFPGGKGAIDKVIKFTEHFFGGGTNYEKPMWQALDIVTEYENAGKPKPDIVFITDDAYRPLDEDLMREWNAAKKRLDMRVFGIGIGCNVSGALTQLSDDVRGLNDMTNVEQVADLFRTI